MSKKRNRDLLVPNHRDERNKKHIKGYNESCYLRAQTADLERLSAEEYSANRRSNINKRKGEN